jgi:phenylpropionate dioxygenase-like ring-hydroxylating dioxygenase large terminal subunit
VSSSPPPDLPPSDLAPDTPLRDAWYFAAGAEAVAPGHVVARTVLGEPVLLGRDHDGRAFALRDICPHRGFPLSAGPFDGREVTCPYHGWRFDTAGTCTAIPPVVEAQQPGPGKIRVRQYPVREQQGNLWVFVGEDETVAPPIPMIDGLGADARPKLREVVTLDGGIDDAVVGLMDPAHGPFIHKSWFWRSGRSTRVKEKQFVPSPWGFTMARHPPSQSRAYLILGGNPATEIVFRLPSVRWEHIIAGRHVMCHFTTLTPVTTTQTLITHSIYWTQPWLTPLKPLLRPFVRAFLAQDRDAMALQQIGLRHRPPLLLLGDPDAQARWYHRLKLEFLRAQAERRPFVNPVKPRSLRWRT